METYQGTFADIEYDGKIIRIISKDGLQVHPIMFAAEEEKRLYDDILKVGMETGELDDWVNLIIEDEACKNPIEFGILLTKLGKRAFVMDWTRNKGRLN